MEFGDCSDANEIQLVHYSICPCIEIVLPLCYSNVSHNLNELIPVQFVALLALIINVDLAKDKSVTVLLVPAIGIEDVSVIWVKRFFTVLRTR